MENNEAVKKAMSIIEKADNVRDKFLKSKTKAMEDIERIEQEIQELSKQEQETYSLFVMDEIELSAYEDIKKQADSKRLELATIQKKLNDMDELEKQELSKIFHEYETEVDKDLTRFRNNVYSKSVNKLVQAKEKFLQEIVDISKENAKINGLISLAHDIEVDAGLKSRNYHSIVGTNPFIDVIGLNIAGSDKPDIGIRELNHVYHQRTTRPSW